MKNKTCLGKQTEDDLEIGKERHSSVSPTNHKHK